MNRQSSLIAPFSLPAEPEAGLTSTCRLQILKAAGSAYANTAFFTSGAAGTANVAPNAPGTSGCPAVPANASFPNVQPASIVGCGTWLGNNPIDPDSSNVIFGSNYNGKFLDFC